MDPEQTQICFCDHMSTYIFAILRHHCFSIWFRVVGSHPQIWGYSVGLVRPMQQTNPHIWMYNMISLECFNSSLCEGYFTLRLGDGSDSSKISSYNFVIYKIRIKIIRRKKCKIRKFIVNSNNPNLWSIQIINEFKNVEKSKM